MMINKFVPGDKKNHQMKVTENDVAAFNEEVIHEVCSTFALAREIEWSSRLFVLEMKEDDEEGIGTKLEIIHKGPAFAGEIVDIEAVVKSLENNELLCTYTARVGERIVAEGITGQRVLKKKRIEEIFQKMQAQD